MKKTKISKDKYLRQSCLAEALEDLRKLDIHTIEGWLHDKNYLLTLVGYCSGAGVEIRQAGHTIYDISYYSRGERQNSLRITSLERLYPLFSRVFRRLSQKSLDKLDFQTEEAERRSIEYFKFTFGRRK